MPIYEFHCEKCGAESEILVATSHWEGTPCPECGSKKLVKKLSVFSASSSNDGVPASCGTTPTACCGCPHQHKH